MSYLGVVSLSLLLLGNPPLHQLQGDVAQVESASRAFQNVFGPVPALAASPFFGMALLTGAALVAKQPSLAHSDSAIVRGLATNGMLLHAQSYATWWLFGIFLMLAIFASVANSGKLHGTVGKFVHVAEAGLVTVAYIWLAAGDAAASAGHSHVLAASVVPAFGLVIAAALAMIPIVIVRLAFDILIWLHPIPFVDLMFQIAKTVFSLAFFAIYLLSPFVAAILAVVCLAPALFMLPWALRFFAFNWNIIIKPLLSRIAPTKNDELFCRAYALKARGFKKRQCVVMFERAGQVVIQPPRRPQRARALIGEGEHVAIARATFWIEVRVIGADGRVLDQFALPFSLDDHYDSLRQLLGALDAGHVGVRGLVHAAFNPPPAPSRAPRTSPP